MLGQIQDQENWEIYLYAAIKSSLRAELEGEIKVYQSLGFFVWAWARVDLRRKFKLWGLNFKMELEL